MAKKRRRKILYIFLALPILLLIAFLIYLPNAFPVLTGYAAKKLCSCHFVAGRDSASIVAQDLGSFPIKYAKVSINEEARSTTATVFGMGKETAVYREGVGCALVHESDSREDWQRSSSLAIEQDTLLWPIGNVEVDTMPNGIMWDSLNAAVNAAFDQKGEETNKKTRAVLVVYKDQVIAEKYAPGFDEHSLHHGWSMTKSMINAMVGILVRQNRMDISQTAGIEAWREDERSKITINHLLQMSSGLEWLEFYYAPTDATRMLFMRDAAGTYASTVELDDEPGTKWNYSSGTTNILSQIIRDRINDDEEYLNFPYKELFDKIGMHSAIIETDASGTWVGSSFGWATARDWAKFGLLYLYDGVWNGERILPENWVDYTTTPLESTIFGKKADFYGAQFWLNAGGEMEGVPKDMFSANGHDGQRVFIIPSRELVIVRLGLKEISHGKLVRGVLKALPE